MDYYLVTNLTTLHVNTEFKYKHDANMSFVRGNVSLQLHVEEMSHFSYM